MRCGNVLMWHLLILVTCSGKSGFHSMKFHRRCTDAVPASGLRLFFCMCVWVNYQALIKRKKCLKSLSVKRKAVPLQADYYQQVINF